jgi:histidinol phosphatase-like enzyme
MSRVGALLDRDGTLIVDSGYVGSVADVRFIPARTTLSACIDDFIWA